MLTTPFDLNTLNGSNGFVLRGIDELDSSGDSVSGAGDVNGDGIDDLIIGASRAEADRNSQGESYVVFGRSNGFDSELNLASLDGSNGFVLRGINELDFSGDSVSGAGDINGDGIDDLIIGAPFAEADRNNQGESYVVFGRNDGFDSELDLASLDGSNGFVLQGSDRGDNSGDSVSRAGDINGDGIDDLIIGAPFAEATEEDSLFNQGESYVVFGRNDGFDSELDLASLDGSNGFVLQGSDRGDNSGDSVSRAGDINGDGIDDLIIGAPFAEATEEDSLFNQGESYVVFGRNDGFDSELDLASLDGSNGFVLRGIDQFDRFGDSVSGAGDINGDGIDDLIIGASGVGNGFFYSGHGYYSYYYNGPYYSSRRGESYVIFGSNNGFDSEFNVASLDGSNGFALGGLEEKDYSGRSVNGAGDVNGDGFDDLIISAVGAGANNEGENYVIFGSDRDFTAEFDLGNLDGNNGVVFPGIDGNDYYGGAISGAGDVNGDGIDDLILGATRANEDRGKSYVVFGVGKTLSNTIQGTVNDDLLRGTSSEDTIAGLSGNDSILGLAGNDSITGGDGADTLRGNLGNDLLEGDLGSDLLFGDRGNDTLAGGDDSDTIRGGAGADLLRGNSGSDLLFGNQGNDLLVGGDGNDTLRGNQQSDRLVGGIGNDTLFGGADADFFVLKAGEGNDIVGDYFDGVDRFILSDGLRFDELKLQQNFGNTQIRLSATDEVLATLNSVTVNSLEAEDFITES